MRASLTKRFLSFTEWLLAEEPQIRSRGFRYGVLTALLALLFLAVVPLVSYPPESYPPSRYNGVIVSLMLLLNHLAHQFRWSQPVKVALRVVVLLYSIAVSLYFVWFVPFGPLGPFEPFIRYYRGIWVISLLLLLLNQLADRSRWSQPVTVAFGVIFTLCWAFVLLSPIFALFYIFLSGSPF